MAKHRTKAAGAYIFLMALYTMLFFAGLLNYSMGTVMFHTGLPGAVENGAVMMLSLLSLIKSVYDVVHL